ncbi:MAG: dodecin domain-containing protein [Anaerolineales bacterium]|nr:dodecin domain-containing protein [Anaerolineales bacterium]
MDSPVYKMIEVVGTSTKSVDDAIQNAVSRASDTVRKMQWFEVSEMSGRIKDGSVSQFQVKLKIGFSIE